jgi:hypothetical protein
MSSGQSIGGGERTKAEPLPASQWALRGLAFITGTVTPGPGGSIPDPGQS